MNQYGKLFGQTLVSHYDKLKPQKPKNLKEMKQKLLPIISNYIMNETRNLGEVKRITGSCREIPNPSK